MKNKEKYAKEIIKISCDCYNIAVNKITGKPEKCCLLINCTECLFSGDDGSCNGNEKTREWAESEYIEKPMISKKDRAFLEYLDKKYKYIARDNYTSLCAHIAKPRKSYAIWKTKPGDKYLCFDGLIGVDFPMVKWSDSEPWLIEDLKKLEVVEEYEI